MSEAFIGEIRIFAGNYAPRGWMFCQGQLIPISQNDALFALIGTTYGGDGQNTFGLPDMRGRIPRHQGTGPGLNTTVIGEKYGVESVTLTPNQLPAHTHALGGKSATNSASPNATHQSPVGRTLASSTIKAYSSVAPTVTLNAAAVQSAGNATPTAHSNMMPTLCLHYIICVEGIFPTRN